MKRILFLLLAFFAISSYAQEISLIPQPAEMTVNEGKFLFRGKVVICYPQCSDKGIDKVLDNFVKEFKETTGVKLRKSTAKNEKAVIGNVTKYSKKGDAHVVINIDETMADEEYRLAVTPKRIDITAAKPAGLFYALQTLKQLMPRRVMAGVPYDGEFEIETGWYDCLPDEWLNLLMTLFSVLLGVALMLLQTDFLLLLLGIYSVVLPLLRIILVENHMMRAKREIPRFLAGLIMVVIFVLDAETHVLWLGALLSFAISLIYLIYGLISAHFVFSKE